MLSQQRTRFFMRLRRSQVLCMITGLSMLFAGCSMQRNSIAPRILPAQYDLMPGDTIQVDYSALGPDGPPFVATVDRRGDVHFEYCRVTVHVKGLSLDQAATAITQAYVPRYFRRGLVRVSRIKPTISGHTQLPGAFALFRKQNIIVASRARLSPLYLIETLSVNACAAFS